MFVAILLLLVGFAIPDFEPTFWSMVRPQSLRKWYFQPGHRSYGRCFRYSMPELVVSPVSALQGKRMTPHLVTWGSNNFNLLFIPVADDFIHPVVQRNTAHGEVLSHYSPLACSTSR